MTDSGQGDGGGADSGTGGGPGDSSSDSSGGGLGGDAGVGMGPGLSDTGPGPGEGPGDPDGTSAPSGFGQADRNSDPANDKGKDAPGYQGFSDATSFQGPATLQTQQVSPSLLSGIRNLAEQKTEEKSAVLSIGLGLLTAAMPAVGILSTITDIARALGLSEEAPSFSDPSEGGEADGAPGPAGNSFLPPGSGPVVTVNPPVFLTVGGSTMPPAAATFAAPSGDALESPAAQQATTEGEGPSWPMIAAAALLAFAAG